MLIQQSIKNNLLLNNIEKSYIITRLKEMTIPELLEALAEAYAGDPSHIYGYLQPDLIDKTTDAWLTLEKW